MSEETKPEQTGPRPTAGEGAHTVRRRSLGVPAAIALGVLGVLGLGALALRHAEGQINEVALSSGPKPVSAVQGRRTEYRLTRRYVGTLEPWQKAGVGPQLVSGFVGSVLVRPGAVVRRGDVLATLDCRNASAASKAVSLEARALEARQRAAAKEAARLEQMLEGGYVSDNEIEQTRAQTAATEARIQGLMAQLQGKQLEVDDCVMRAPFAGEVAERLFDPGAFIRPGAAIVTLVDRDVVRLTADVPEVDFKEAAPAKVVRIQLLATGQITSGTIARRAPSADPETRTIHIEIDLPDAKRQIPVGTTAVIELDIGEPQPALELPLTAATIRARRATLFVVRDDAAHKTQVDVLGERGGSVFVAPVLGADARVVTEGRSLLANGDRVAAKVEVWQ